jgi:hypothetical protein
MEKYVIKDRFGLYLVNMEGIFDTDDFAMIFYDRQIAKATRDYLGKMFEKKHMFIEKAY